MHPADGCGRHDVGRFRFARNGSTDSRVAAARGTADGRWHICGSSRLWSGGVDADLFVVRLRVATVVASVPVRFDRFGGVGIVAAVSGRAVGGRWRCGGQCWRFVVGTTQVER